MNKGEKILASSIGLFASMLTGGPVKPSGRGLKRKPRVCRAGGCKRMTDHKGGYCSSECARGDKS